LLYDHQIKRSREKGRAAAADRVQKRNTTKGTLTDIKIRLGAFQFCFGACRKAASVWWSFRIPANVLWYIKYELQLILISAAHRIVCYSKLSF